MSQDDDALVIDFINTEEKKIALMLELGDSHTRQIVSLQRAGNTARFEDIAVRLEFVSAQDARNKLRAKMFLRVYSQEIMSWLTALIFLVAAASFVHDVVTGIGQRQIDKTKAREMPEAVIRLRILPYSASYEKDIFQKPPWSTYRITVKDSAKPKDPGLILMIGNAGDRLFLGCLSGTAQLKDTSLHLDRVMGEKTNRHYAPGEAVAYLTSYEYHIPAWERDALEFDLGCDGEDDHAHVDFDLVDL